MFDFQFTKTESNKKRNASPAKPLRNTNDFKLFGKSLQPDKEERSFDKYDKFDDNETTQASKNTIPTFTKGFPQMTEE